MKKLLDSIEGAKKSPIRDEIRSRLEGFRDTWNRTSLDVFREYCFCALTANFDAGKGIRIHEAIGDGFFHLSERELAAMLKSMGYRFPNTRAEYITESRKFMRTIKPILESYCDDKSKREWLVKNVKGLGYKEASHFLRNIGHSGVAILDFHIIDLLERHGLVKRPKTMTRKRYLEIEGVLEKLCRKLGMTQGELDFYLWYLETGKVLK